MTFAFGITLLTGVENWIDDLRDCACRSPTVLSAEENPRFILSRLEARVAVFTILCFSANLTCLYMDEFLKHLVFCPLNGWSKIRPVHAQRWHRRWSTRFNGTTETTDCIGLKQTFSVYHHNFEHVLGHKALNMEQVLEFYILHHLSREGILCCTQS